MSSNVIKTARAVKGKPIGRSVLRRGEMLTRKQLIARMRISPATLKKWEEDGLPVYGEGMEEYVYISDDIFDFLRTRPIRNRTRKEK
jgi:hypothetical protein